MVLFISILLSMILVMIQLISKHHYRLIFLFSFILLINHIGLGQDDSEDNPRVRLFGGHDREIGTSMSVSENGEILIVTSSRSFGSGKDAIWLLKLNSNEDTVWTKVLSSVNSQRTGTYSLVANADNSWTIGGSAYIDKERGYDIFITKIDSVGNEIWRKTYGGIGRDQLESIQKTKDEGYLIAGATANEHWEVPWLIKTDSDGNTMWTQTYPGDGNGFIEAAIETNDGGYVTAGSADDNWSDSVAYSIDLVVRKLTDQGKLKWEWRYGGKEIHVAPEWIIETKEGDYVVVGPLCEPCSPTLKNYQTHFDAFIVKLTSEGDTLWTRRIGGNQNDLAYFVIATQANTYLLGGSTSSQEGPSDSPWLVEVNSDGKVIWSKTLPSSFPRNGVSQIYEYKKNKFVITGPPYLYQRGGAQDLWLMWLDK